VGIAYKKGTTAPNVMSADIQTGTPGNGGNGADAPGDGAKGSKGATLELN
jgi:hypothetical protein